MSGIQFSSPVTNQKASPAIHASSLATRPSPQLPGRIFVDTDNPSTGMYRDTGTAWVQLSSGSGTVPDLQSVCDVGFLTDTDMTFLYTNSADTSKIGFLNQAVGDFTFDIFKKANEFFSIRALKPSTVDEEMEIILDAPNNTIKTNYNSNDTGLLMNFVNDYYLFGNFIGNAGGILSISLVTNTFNVTDPGFGHNYFSVVNDSTDINFPNLSIDGTNNIIKTQSNSVDIGLKMDFTNMEVYLGDPIGASLSVIEMIGRNIRISNNNQNFSLYFDDNNAEIVSTFGGPDVGMKLGFTANQYQFGDFGYTFNGHSLMIDDAGETIYTKGSNTQNGLILDFGGEKFRLGSTTEYIGIDTLNNTLIAGANLTSGTSGGTSGQHLKININGTNYKIELKNP